MFNKGPDNRYEFQQANPTISNLVQPPVQRQNPDNPYTSRDQYTNGSRRSGDSAYESTRRTGDHQYPVTDDRQSNNSGYTRRVPTADILVDPYRRPAHGNARTCVLEINIAVNLGSDRTSQASVITNNFPSKPPAIRSTAIIDDVRYVDLNFQTSDHTAQLSTDGIIRSSASSRNSTGFQNKNTDE